MEEEYIEATPIRRTQFLVGMAIAISLIAFVEADIINDLLKPNDNLSLEETTKYGLVQSIWLTAISLVFVIISLVTAKLGFNYAGRIISSSQHPPPGAKIPFRHKISRGKHARVSGYLTMGLFSLLVVKFIVLLYVQVQFLQQSYELHSYATNNSLVCDAPR